MMTKTWTGYAAFRQGKLLWGCFDTDKKVVERYQLACYANLADDDISADDLVKFNGISVEQIQITRVK
jgi:hypothetical protein